MNENNFGRRLKELKRARSVMYSEISAATKIRRDRLISLEENEVVPTEAERQALAEFYNVPIQELGASSAAPRPQARQATPEPRPMRMGSYESEPPLRDSPNRRVPQRSPLPPRQGPNGNSTYGARPYNESGRPQSHGSPPSKRNMQQSRSGHEALGDMEAGFLRKQQDTRTPMIFHFINGKTFSGTVTGFTPYVIMIKDEATGEEQVLRKLAIAYYEKKEIEKLEQDQPLAVSKQNGSSTDVTPSNETESIGNAIDQPQEQTAETEGAPANDL